MASRRRVVRCPLQGRRLLMGRFTLGRDTRFRSEFLETCFSLFPRSRLILRAVSAEWGMLVKTSTLENRKRAAPKILLGARHIVNLKEASRIESVELFKATQLLGGFRYVEESFDCDDCIDCVACRRFIDGGGTGTRYAKTNFGGSGEHDCSRSGG